MMKKLLLSFVMLTAMLLNVKAVSISTTDGVVTLNYNNDTDVSLLDPYGNPTTLANSLPNANDFTTMKIIGNVPKADIQWMMNNGKFSDDRNKIQTLDLSSATISVSDLTSVSNMRAAVIILPNGSELPSDSYYENSGLNNGKLRYICALSSDQTTITIGGGTGEFNNQNAHPKEEAVTKAINENRFPFNVSTVTNISYKTGEDINGYFVDKDIETMDNFNKAHTPSDFKNGVLMVSGADYPSKTLTEVAESLSVSINDITEVQLPDGTIWKKGSDGKGTITSNKANVNDQKAWLSAGGLDVSKIEEKIGKYVSKITEGNTTVVQIQTNGVNSNNLDNWPEIKAPEKDAIRDATNVKLVGDFTADALSAIRGKNTAGITTLDLSEAGWPAGTLLTGLYNETDKLQTLTLPATATSIPAQFASGFTALTTVNMPEGVETIGNLAFSGCTSLSTINWPASLTAIGTETTATGDFGPFQGCTSLTTVDLSGCTNLTLVGKDAFHDCTGLTSITLPTSLVTIAGEAFESTGLTSVDLTDCENLKTIDFEAFENNAALTTFTFPKKNKNVIEKIGNSAFSCSGITEINMSNCTEIKTFSSYDGGTYTNEDGDEVQGNVYQTFYNCTDLTKVVLPPNLTEVPDDYGNGLFFGCSNLVTVEFTGTADYDTETCGKYENGKTNQLKADNQLTIGAQAFKDMPKLKNVTLSNNIISIGRKAFQAAAIEEIHIPASVETVGAQAFMDCHSLAVVVFDEIADGCEPCLHAKTTIVGLPDGDGAFRQCDHITDVYVNTTVDIECENKAFDYNSTFGHTNVTAPLATLHYPEGHETHYVNLNHYLTEEVAGDAGLFQAWLQKHFEAASDPLATEGGYEPNGWYEFVNSGPSRDPDDPEYEIYDNGDVILRTFSDYHYARIVPKGIKAYIIKKIEPVEKAISQDNPDEKIKYFQLTLQSIPVIPAQTGVILYGEPNANQVDQNGVTKRTLAMSAVQYKPGEGQPLRRDYWNELATELTQKQVEAKITEPDNIRLKNYLMPLDTEDASAIHLKPYERDPQTGAVAFRTFIMSRFGETLHLQHTDGLNYAANNDNYMGFFRVVEGDYSGGYAYLRFTSEEFNEAEGAECRVKMDEKYQYEYNESGKDYDATKATPWKYWRYADWTERTKNWGARPARFDNFSIGAVRFLGELEDADGIIKVTIPAEVTSNDDYYTLQGVKVTNPSKGVYIRNGKKVVVK